MKKVLLSLVLAVMITGSSFSQVGFNAMPTLSRPPIFGSSPFQDSLWAIDTVGFGVKYRSGPSIAGFTITGMTSLTMHPHTGEYFIVMKLSGVTGRVLGKFNPLTGVCTQVGNLGDNFATISFREDGQLFGVTGDGATVSETMYLIDQTNASKVLATALGSGADGEVIAYNYDDDLFYHWSGNGTVVCEKVMSVAPYAVSLVPIIGATSGETFGAAYLGGGKFRTSNISSSFNNFFSTGNVSPAFGGNPDDLRGLGLIGRWVNRPGSSTICNSDSALLEAFATTGVSNRHKFQWVKDGVNIAGATSSTYYANQTGWYNCRIILDSLYTNGQTMDSTISAYTDTAWYGRSVIVNPAAGLNPTPNAYICSVTDSVALFNSNYSGINSWYYNGSLMPGESNDTLWTTSTGSYNVSAVQVPGCVDTMSTPTLVSIAPTPTLSASSNLCFGDSVLLTANAGSAGYDWLLNGSLSVNTGTPALYVSADGDYSAVTTFGSCIDTSSIVTIAFAPQYNVTPNGAGEICFATNQLLTATAGGSSYQWLMNGGIIGGATSSTYNAASNGDYTCIITYPGCTDTAVSQYTLTIAPQYNVTPAGSGSICIGSNQLLTATGGGSSYQWLMNGSAIGGATSATYNATATGNYECIVTFPGCTDTTVTNYNLTAVDCSGIEEYNSEIITLYPNPVHDKLNISISNDGIIETISIVDLSGRKIMTTNPNSSNASINVEHISTGTYIINIASQKGSKAKKFVKY